MAKKLPHREFKWVDEEKLQNINPHTYNESSDYGMILEVISQYKPEIFTTFVMQFVGIKLNTMICNISGGFNISRKYV